MTGTHQTGARRWEIAVGRNRIVPGLGKRLKEAREGRGLSQDDVAERTEELGESVSKNAISRIENDHMSPTAGVLLSLCRALQVDPNDVLEWTTTDKDEFAAEVRKVARWMLRLAEEGDIAPVLSEEELPPRDERTGKGRGVGTPRQNSAG